MTIQVTLLSHSEDPLRSLYMAYRTCYSQLTPQQVAKRIDDDRITREEMTRFIEERIRERPEQWLWIHKRWVDEDAPKRKRAQTLSAGRRGANSATSKCV